MANWRKIRNIITIADSIGFEIKEFPSCNAVLYHFNCLVCKKLLKIRLKHIPYSTGKCKKHANMHKPFEASYGGMKRNAKGRNLQFSLTYEDYIEFTKQSNCTYCGDKIKWRPYNEHGKNNPAYFLDRYDNNKGYLKENCVVCCTTCNIAKKAMHGDKFIEMANKIFNHQQELMHKLFYEASKKRGW